MTEPAIPELGNDLLLVQLAREIAMNFHPLEAILKRYNIDQGHFQRIMKLPRFVSLLEAATTEWESALNTQERIKLKSAAMLEDWLPTAHTRLNDNSESLGNTADLAKFIGRLAGVGVNGANINGGAGEKVSVTINLGNDKKLNFEKTVTPKAIDVSDGDY